MTKKIRKIKKDIKRQLNSIEFKRSCKNLKKNFLNVFKTAIYDSSYFNEKENPCYFHPAWRVLQQPYIQELDENGYVLDHISAFLPLNVTKVVNHISRVYKRHGEKVCVTIFNFQDMEENWIVI